jgi:hypothetical protein
MNETLWVNKLFPQEFAPIDINLANCNHIYNFAIKKQIAWLDCALNIQMTMWLEWLEITQIHIYGALHLSYFEFQKLKLKIEIYGHDPLWNTINLGSWIKWLQFYYHGNIQLDEDMFKLSCGSAYQVQPMCKYCKTPNA